MAAERNLFQGNAMLPQGEHKILIIDDERDLVYLIQKALEYRHYSVVCAHDGIEGYEKFLKEKPHLIIMDVMMPRLNGFELCRKIRNEECEQTTPILMLTAKNEDADRIVGRVIGAEKFMTKPFEVEELLSEVELLLHHAN